MRPAAAEPVFRPPGTAAPAATRTDQPVGSASAEAEAEAALDAATLPHAAPRPELRWHEISIVPPGTPAPRGIAAYLAASHPLPAPVALIDAAV
ncbi:MAG: hypothetical protein IPQ24_09830 [Anaeromyxobacter sp.]|nr:hypothetical protein [Anaeromyxobacter sp.]